MNGLKLYFRMLGISVRAQMEYRASFIFQTIGNFLATGIEFVALWGLFDRFGSVRGWSMAEVGLLFGLVNLSFAIAEAAAYGFDAFSGTIKGGGFDLLLLRPRSIVLQLLGQRLAMKNLGRFLQGAAVLLWAMATLNIHWSVAKCLLLMAASAGIVLLFFSLMVLQATMAFWTIESLEIMNALTYGGIETGQLPMTIYPAWLQKFFIFVVPLACVSYFPVLAILDRPAPADLPTATLYLAPASSLLFMSLAFVCWRTGVRHYTSTGS